MIIQLTKQELDTLCEALSTCIYFEKEYPDANKTEMQFKAHLIKLSSVKSKLEGYQVDADNRIGLEVDLQRGK